MTTTTTTAEMVDRLGELKAEIADLQEEFDYIKSELIKQRVTKEHGVLFQMTLSTFRRRVTDWRAIATKLKAKTGLIEQHTRLITQHTLRVSSRS